VLRALGLEQYAPTFRANRIDADLLPNLTAEDLKDLGVTLVGDRRRLSPRRLDGARRAPRSRGSAGR
jgi:SAM (Sterile alpha motif) domain-containing protein